MSAPDVEDCALFHRPRYQAGIPAVIEAPDAGLGELLETAAHFYPDRVAIDFLGATTTYRELLEASERAARLLHDAGVRRGDRVALIMPNCPQHVVAFFAVLSLGATVAEHNPLAPPKELREQISQRGSRAAIVWEQTLEALAADADTATAELARELLEGWDAAPPEEEPLGLWREPSLLVPELLPEFTDDALVLDEPALLALLTDIDTWWWLSAFRYERLLATFVATARAGGPEHLVRLIGRNVSPAGWCGFLTRLVVCLGDGTIVPGQGIRPAASPSGPLSFLAAQRARDIFGLLGELPCLLSTPTHEGFRVAWEVFRERVGRFREAGVELVPTDVAVALARLDRTCAPRDVSDLDLPIRGIEVRLSGVLAHWRDDEPRPGVLRLSPASEDDRPYLNRPVARLIADGDEPGTFGPLGLRNAWADRFHPDRSLYWDAVRDLPEAWPEPEPDDTTRIESAGDDGAEVHVQPREPIIHISDSEATLTLLPAHPSRPAALVLQELGHNYPTKAVDGFLPIAAVAGRFGPVLSFVTLAVISGAALKDRDRVAEALLTAWDEGRLLPGDLVDAWRSPWWDELNDMPRVKYETWPHSPAKTVTVLCTIADAGGLALAWPLLVAIAEELAGQRKTTAATATTLEAVLRYLPEVRAVGIAVDLPNVAALAAWKGNGKAMTVARRITKMQGS